LLPDPMRLAMLLTSHTNYPSDSVALRQPARECGADGAGVYQQ
jgi:hypothetical protein